MGGACPLLLPGVHDVSPCASPRESPPTDGGSIAWFAHLTNANTGERPQPCQNLRERRALHISGTGRLVFLPMKRAPPVSLNTVTRERCTTTFPQRAPRWEREALATLCTHVIPPPYLSRRDLCSGELAAPRVLSPWHPYHRCWFCYCRSPLTPTGPSRKPAVPAYPLGLMAPLVRPGAPPTPSAPPRCVAHHRLPT